MYDTWIKNVIKIIDFSKVDSKSNQKGENHEENICVLADGCYGRRYYYRIYKEKRVVNQERKLQRKLTIKQENHREKQISK